MPADYSYRTDASVPKFPDDRPIILFDGICELCSGMVRFVAEHDSIGLFRFMPAQSELGRALYRHYGLDPSHFETNLVIAEGRAYTKMATVAAIAAKLGWPWRLAVAAGFLPKGIGDWLYDRIAERRYRVFGKREVCLAPVGALKDRFLVPPPEPRIEFGEALVKRPDRPPTTPRRGPVC